jgi:DNA-binding NtrC family response regulator
MKKRILVVDDDKRILAIFERILSRREFEVNTCLSSKEAIHKIMEKGFDVIISDQFLNEMDGMELLSVVQKFSPQVPFIVITGYGSIERAVESVKKGAFDYLIKPFGRDHILEAIERAIQASSYNLNRKPQQENQNIFFENIIGKSKKMQELFALVSKIVATDATILIQGESGTGKELIAKAIHQLSPRKSSPFIAINCGVLSENLLENELFGHVKGAFTGAIQRKRGLFEEAHKGTLFLDEVADIPPAVQTKLLRVLQEKEFKPLGSNEIIRVDVRLIGATNVNLYQSVLQKKFREDLYYRLAVIPIFVSPLRERIEDIPDLAMHFAQKYSKQNGKKIEYIEPQAMQKLMQHTWQGNVRELENTIERAVALSTSNTITSDILWQGIENLESYSENSNLLKKIVHRNTEEAILKALEITQGSRSKAAQILGISRATLYQKLKKCNIQSRRLK